MDTERAAQTSFSFRHDKEIRIDFDGGEITSDAGVIARRTLRVLRENAISATEVGALNELLTESFIVHRSPPTIIIDVDGTDDPAHGQQQLIGFNGFYNQYMHHPLLIHEGLTGCLLGTLLRPGNAHAAENVLSALRPIVERLKETFPHAIMFLRTDSGFAVPRLYDFCEANCFRLVLFALAYQLINLFRRRLSDPEL